jgi:hypothetical protein
MSEKAVSDKNESRRCILSYSPESVLKKSLFQDTEEIIASWDVGIMKKARRRAHQNCERKLSADVEFYKFDVNISHSRIITSVQASTQRKIVTRQ